MKIESIAYLLFCILALASCDQKKDVKQANYQQSNLSNKSLTANGASLPPTATELFNLRGECAKLGQKILQENLDPGTHTETQGKGVYTETGSIGFQQDQTSYYDPVSGHCYIKLFEARTFNKNYDHQMYLVSLYDGQTSDLLASASFISEGYIKDQPEKKAGIVFNSSLPISGYDNTISYINNLMTETASH